MAEEKLAHELMIERIEKHYDTGGMNRPKINEAIIEAVCDMLSRMRMTTPHIVDTALALEKMVQARDCPGKEFIRTAIEALRGKISSHPQTAPLTTKS